MQRSPQKWYSVASRAIEALHTGDVAVEQLVEWNRASKPLEGYSQNTQNVEALK